MAAERLVLAGEGNLFAFGLVLKLGWKSVLLVAKLRLTKQWLLLV